jgi:hypothetical protein
MPKKEAWSQSGFYSVLMRSEIGGWLRNAANLDRKTPICGLKAVLMWSSEKGL